MKNKNQYALITGATSGIGYELAKCFAKDGYNIVMAARTEEDLQRVAKKFRADYQIDVITIQIDLFNVQNAFALYDEVKAKDLTISVLVNDAGQGQYGKFTETYIQRELDIIGLNILSVVVLSKLFLKEMVARGEGKILNLSSVASKMPGVYQSVYHGTKAFIQSFTEAIRNEVKDTGVVVTALLPGATDTDFFNKAEMQQSKIIAEGKLDDPAKVARDGYEALMQNKDKVVSGIKNKITVAMSNLTPDDKLAEKVHQQQKPVSEENK